MDYHKLKCYTYSLFFEKSFNDKSALRYAIEYTPFNKIEYQYGTSIVEPSSANTTVFNCEYLHRVETHDKGAYFIVGPGIMLTTAEAELFGRSGSVSANGFILTGGIGYNFSRGYGIEAKYTRSLWLKFPYAEYAVDWSYFQIGVSVRF